MEKNIHICIYMGIARRHGGVASGHSRIQDVAAPTRHATPCEGEGGKGEGLGLRFRARVRPCESDGARAR